MKFLQDADAVLKELAEKHNIKYERSGSVTINGDENITVKGLNFYAANQLSKDVSNYHLYADSFGLKKNWIGKTFVHNGEVLTIAGINPRKYKNAVMLTAGNKRYNASPDFVKRFME